jgi:2-polyprenyl-3-methyl-5-hydroxy-6-metoxy-1,4-benzoquinol methylase
MKQTQYGLYTYNSPNFIRRTTHKLRLKRSIQALNLLDSDSILDYGAGDGYLAKQLNERGGKNITCYEPMDEQFDQMQYFISDLKNINKVKNIDILSKQKFSKIFCLEVLEHLPEIQLNKTLQTIHTLLDTKGKVLLTVPCESGANGFIKNSIKKIVDNNKTYSFKDLWDIAFNNKKIARVIEHSDTTPYIYKHFGFNNAQFEECIIANKFIIESKINFPLKYLSLFSSQVFYVISK